MVSKCGASVLELLRIELIDFDCEAAVADYYLVYDGILGDFTGSAGDCSCSGYVYVKECAAASL